jgi:large subunit ribosomal protein L4
MKILALESSIAIKLKENDLVILEDVKLKEPKTKEMQKILDNLKIKDKSLLLVEKIEPNLKFGCSNLPNLTLLRAEDVTAYDILRYKKLILTKLALEKILKRFS